jgi:hypothetical protein
MGGRDRDVLEAASFGFDEYLQGFGSDPALSPVSVGLRVPALAGVWYLFLGARADLDPGDAVVSYAQLVTIAQPKSVDPDTPLAAPLIPFERSVSSPQWHPPDGFVSMHVTTQPKIQAGPWRAGPLDQEGFLFEDSSTPALLYESATIPAVPSAPGYLGLTAYTPPAMRGQSILTLRDLRAPWHRPARMRFTIDRPTTIRAYIAVRQTNPDARAEVVIPPTDYTIEGLGPEDNFAQAFVDYQYWRVGIRLGIERARRQAKRKRKEAPK